MIDQVWLYPDGAARGNPGRAAAGYQIRDAADEPLTPPQAAILGHRTNNQAEYEALIMGLGACRAFTTGRVRVGSDCLLMVNQMNGRWRVQDAELRSLHDAAKDRALRFAEVHFRHYPRRHPRIAEVDRELNALLDRTRT